MASNPFLKVVKIKSDDEEDEATPAKAKYAKAHFERVNQKLREVNLADLEKQYRGDGRQHYALDLLRPSQFTGWIKKIKTGQL